MMRPIPKALFSALLIVSWGGLPLRATDWSGLVDAADSFARITELLQGINSFLSGIALISGTIGFPTIVLFLAVILFSAGFTAIGVPRGKPSFFLSLAAANLIWILWNVSLQARISEYVGAMAKANLIILAPAAAVAVAVRIAPTLASLARRARSGLLRKKDSPVSDDAAKLLAELNEKSSRLGASLLADILAAGGDPRVRISDVTGERAGALREMIDRILGAGRR